FHVLKAGNRHPSLVRSQSHVRDPSSGRAGFFFAPANSQGGVLVRQKSGYPSGLALLAQLVEHLHGKEGVDGSSPSEGFEFSPAQPVLLLSGLAAVAYVGVHAASSSVHRGGCLTL